jgi:hypothetical protein
MSWSPICVHPRPSAVKKCVFPFVFFALFAVKFSGPPHSPCLFRIVSPLFSLKSRRVTPRVDMHVIRRSEKEGRKGQMKTGTMEATCFRHLAGRSAASPADFNIGSNAEHIICRSRVLTPKLNSPKLQRPKLLSSTGPIRRKWLILVEFVGFLSNLRRKINFFRPRSFAIHFVAAGVSPIQIKASADSRRKCLISLILPGFLTSF